jgi:hypothetical protein
MRKPSMHGSEDSVSIDAGGLFPRNRGYMVDFIHLFASHFSTRVIRDVATARN